MKKRNIFLILVLLFILSTVLNGVFVSVSAKSVSGKFLQQAQERRERFNAAHPLPEKARQNAAQSIQKFENAAQALSNSYNAVFDREFEKKLDMGMFPLSSDELERIEQLLEDNEKTMGEISEILLAGSCIVDPDPPADITAQSTDWRAISILRLLYEFDVAFAVQEHQPERAFNDLMNMLRLVDGLAHSPLIIGQVVRMRVMNDVSLGISLEIPPGFFTETQVEEILNCVEGMDYTDAMAVALSEETVFSMNAVGQQSLPLIGGINVNKSAEIASQMLAILDNPDGDSYQALDELRADTKALLTFPYIVTKLTSPALIKSAQSQFKHKVRVDMLRLGLSVELYQMRNGKLPVSLDELEMEVPMNAMTGEPYGYEVNDGEFRLFASFPFEGDLNYEAEWRADDPL